MPLHAGHIALARHALAHCRRVTLLVCAQGWEEIPGPLRLRWAQETFRDEPRLTVDYTDVELPYTAHSSREISRIWADYFRGRLPDLDAVCTSEPYGEYLAEYLGIAHLSFDPPRVLHPVSGEAVRAHPFRYWAFLPPAVRPYFVRKICLYGPESVGKTTLAERLARHYGTVWAPEAARTLIPDSRSCTLAEVAALIPAQAELAEAALPQAERLLFCDTDYFTTQVYAEYLFGAALPLEPDWLAAHRFDLYLFLDTDVPYAQDGTRLGAHTRAELRRRMLDRLDAAGAAYTVIGGGWEARFRAACETVDAYAAPFW